jgi:hypothetical protein
MVQQVVQLAAGPCPASWSGALLAGLLPVLWPASSAQPPADVSSECRWYTTPWGAGWGRGTYAVGATQVPGRSEQRACCAGAPAQVNAVMARCCLQRRTWESCSM